MYQKKLGDVVKYEPRICFVARVDLDLTYRKIQHVVLSPGCANLLITSGN